MDGKAGLGSLDVVEARICDDGDAFTQQSVVRKQEGDGRRKVNVEVSTMSCAH